MAALVVTLGAGVANAGERTYTRAEVAQILDIIDQHVARRAAKEQRAKDAAATRQRIRAAKMHVALRMAAEHKAERARSEQTKQATREAHQARRARLLHLLTGGRSGTGAVRRAR